MPCSFSHASIDGSWRVLEVDAFLIIVAAPKKTSCASRTIYWGQEVIPRRELIYDRRVDGVKKRTMTTDDIIGSRTNIAFISQALFMQD